MYTLYIYATDKKRIWIMFDEFQDASGNSVGALSIGCMDDMKIGPFLVHLDILDSCDTAGYKKFVMAGLNAFYPNGEYMNLDFILIFFFF